MPQESGDDPRRSALQARPAPICLTARECSGMVAVSQVLMAFSHDTTPDALPRRWQHAYVRVRLAAAEPERKCGRRAGRGGSNALTLY